MTEIRSGNIETDIAPVLSEQVNPVNNDFISFLINNVQNSAINFEDNGQSFLIKNMENTDVNLPENDQINFNIHLNASNDSACSSLIGSLESNDVSTLLIEWNLKDLVNIFNGKFLYVYFMLYANKAHNINHYLPRAQN